MGKKEHFQLEREIFLLIENSIWFIIFLLFVFPSPCSIDVVQAQKEASKMPKCPLEIRASDADNAAGANYFSVNKAMIRGELLKYGAIWLRGFDLMKSVSGYREMWEALEMEPCLDPLHSSGLRKFASERDALYEEVNKPSLRGHYIGLHCESTTKRTAAYAGFVCFQRATESGGRFLVADGAAILAELDTNLLKKLYNRKIRISVSNLDIPPAFPAVVKNVIKDLVDVAVAPKFDMDLEMIYEADGKPGRLQVSYHVFRGSTICFTFESSFQFLITSLYFIARLSRRLNLQSTDIRSLVYRYGSIMHIITHVNCAIDVHVEYQKLV